jgi:hypothetical protein
VIINPNTPSGYTIFCDDIRHEVTGKTTLVGVYNNQLIVTGITPVTIPQICAAITLRILPPEKPLNPVIKIFRNDQTDPLFVFEADIEPAENSLIPAPMPNMESDSVTFLQIGITAQMQAITIDESCTLRVRAFIENDEVRLGSLQIVVNSVSSSAQEPLD